MKLTPNLIKKCFATLSSFCFFSSVGFSASNPASVGWVESYVQSQLGNTTSYELFQEAQGGIIYYLDSTKKHGLVAATSDLEGQSQWLVVSDEDLSSEVFIGAVLDELFQGFQNTTLIVSAKGETAQAASACSHYSSPYSNWYLPSQQELNQMYYLRAHIGGFDTEQVYWSSSESRNSGTQAVAQIFSNGAQQPANKNSAANIRCTRAF